MQATQQIYRLSRTAIALAHQNSKKIPRFEVRNSDTIRKKLG